ncbi:uncharacterized protein LOC133121296 [Conger conger]|uniref:uncharacterized protein LOC133121296 n=1 Tax=Conger conger TaxID=82655 RepID=UPI002A5AC1CA|nr:uncharacterized protein LOC133121296 [Conger conger]
MDVNTLKLKVTVCTLTSFLLFHFKSTVLEYRAKRAEILPDLTVEQAAVMEQRSERGPLARPPVPRPSEADQARRLNEVWRYLEDRGLQRCAEALCVDALRDPRSAPANPYPAFTQRLCQLAQRGRLRLSKSSSDEAFRRAVSFPTTLTAVRHVAGAKGCSHVWGLPSILRCVSPQEMGRYRWLLEDVTPPLSNMGHHSPYTVSGDCERPVCVGLLQSVPAELKGLPPCLCAAGPGGLWSHWALCVHWHPPPCVPRALPGPPADLHHHRAPPGPRPLALRTAPAP